ncbi:MAG: hypothetical protein WDM78_20305 [Puia sp.]
MRLEKHQIDELNQQQLANHKRRFEFIAEELANVNDVIQKLSAFNIAIPSWALEPEEHVLDVFPVAASHAAWRKK